MPKLEPEDFFLVGQRDLETFIEPYNRSVIKALKLFKEHELPYTPLDFEYLAMTIMVE